MKWSVGQPVVLVLDSFNERFERGKIDKVFKNGDVQAFRRRWPEYGSKYDGRWGPFIYLQDEARWDSETEKRAAQRVRRAALDIENRERRELLRQIAALYPHPDLLRELLDRLLREKAERLGALVARVGA